MEAREIREAICEQVRDDYGRSGWGGDMTVVVRRERGGGAIRRTWSAIEAVVGQYRPERRKKRRYISESLCIGIIAAIALSWFFGTDSLYTHRALHLFTLIPPLRFLASHSVLLFYFRYTYESRALTLVDCSTTCVFARSVPIVR